MSEMIEIAGLDAEEAEKKRVIDEQAEANRLQHEAELKPIRERLELIATEIKEVCIPMTLSIELMRAVTGILETAAERIRELVD